MRFSESGCDAFTLAKIAGAFAKVAISKAVEYIYSIAVRSPLRN